MQVARVAPGWPAPSLMHRRRVMGDRITYVGLDVHKDTIVVAVADGGLRGEVREYGRIANTAAALDRLARKLGGDGVMLRFCYEARPCGYGIQRQLSARGHECVVVAPSLIPKRPGDRVKTDRRGAGRLGRPPPAGGGAARGGAGPARGDRPGGGGPTGPPAALGLSVAPGPPLRTAGVDQAASSMAGGSQVRAGSASPRTRGLSPSGRGRRGPARSADGADRRDAAGLDAGPGGG